MTTAAGARPSAPVAALALSSANMAVRTAGLAGRFALTLYLAKYFDLKDIGTFGLIAGAGGILPSVLGCGINYFLTREIVGAQPLRAGTMLRDRLAFTLAMSLLAVAVAGTLAAVGLVPLPPNALLVVWILIAESFAFDIHMSLISLRLPVAANSLLFVRSAGWVFPAIACGLLLGPRYRTLDFVLHCWGAGLVANFVCLFAFVVRGWPVRAIARTRVDVHWLARTVRGGSLIYLSELGNVGQIYLDRYIVEHYLGIKQVGVYTLYWTMANAVYVLVAVGVVQLLLPQLVESHRRGIKGEWRSAFVGGLVKIVQMAVPLCIAFGVVVLHVLPRLGMKQFGVSPLLFELLLVGVIVRLVSDGFGQGLYSRNLDGSFAAMNILGLLVTATISTVLIGHWGLLGIGVGTILSPAVLLGFRGVLLAKSYVRDAPVVVPRSSG
jgi:O-antigen/teichoic acid export membrane protein